MAASLAERKVLVVGASAGIGRSIAMRAISDGADVLVAARRADRLDQLVAEAGGGTSLVVDVSRGDQAARMTDAVSALGGLDLVVYSVGSAPLRLIANTVPEDWDAVMRTNVVGFNEVVRAVLPHLSPTSVVAALSSEIVDHPRAALAAYAASKAALEVSIRAWRTEHPGRRFCCIRVGATVPTEFGDAFDGDVLRQVLDRWVMQGLVQEEFMDTDDVAAVLVDTLAVLLAHPGVAIEDLVLRSPSPVVGSARPAIANARVADAGGLFR